MRFNEFLRVREQCLGHATRLAKDGEVMFNVGSFNVAFHLGLLALEELGKIIIVFSKDHGKLNGPVRMNARNHIDKIAWILLMVRCEQDSKNIIFRTAAAYVTAFKLHNKRMKGLYVDHSKAYINPTEAVSMDEAQALLRMAYVALKIEEERFWMKPPLGTF